ncbi:hypothetical protein [Sphingomonas phyllosphaerae]|uniref:hypothetical protein n=1 Tax=Sphingomonas phyllosphaerae TaxID=257003 RepID=UPI00056904CC|nr:hypothetical protein [Sphingomonas phyllosphaerae]
MRGFEKRQAEREAQKEREAEEWRSVRAKFRQKLEGAGAQLDPLFVEVRAHSPSSDGEWFTWWLRDEVVGNTVKVQNAIAANFITHVTLHSGRMAAPGESGTARMWLDAERAGSGELDAALMLTAMRATETVPELRWGKAVSTYREKLFRWSWDTLKAAAIDPYTLSSRWFLPRLLQTDREARDEGELVDLIAANLASFLLEWTPVRIEVIYSAAEASAGESSWHCAGFIDPA